jgi:hypothetical protein
MTFELPTTANARALEDIEKLKKAVKAKAEAAET